MKGNGQGDLTLSEKVLKEFYSYITTKVQNNPLNFFITADHKSVFIEIRKNTTYKGISGSGPISRNKKKCEQKYKQECFLFANQRVVVWNNGINPIDSKNSKINSKSSFDELIVKLNELGFIETKEQKVAEEKRIADEKIAEEKRIADEKEAEEKRIADEKEAEEKRIADEKEAEEKRIVEQKAAEEKKLSLIPDEIDLEFSQQFLENVKTFIKLYPDEFDIIKVFEFILITRPITDDILNDKLKEDLKLFIEFTNSSDQFVKYRIDKKKGQ